jgi:hypothetical protein
VNKKKQKNFIMLGHGRRRRQSPWPNGPKIFAPLFLKAAAFLSPRKQPYGSQNYASQIL